MILMVGGDDLSEVITLDISTPSVKYLCKKDKRLAKVIHMVGPITYTPYNHEKIYSFMVHEVIEQMLSVKAGKKIFGRLEELCNGYVTAEKVNQLSNEQLKNIGTSESKVRCIRELTEAVIRGDLDFNKLSGHNDSDVQRELTKLYGIGNWTAKMFLIFVLNRQDVLPFEDGAFLQVYRWVYKTDDDSKEAVKKKCKKWSPYASVGARFFYRALDTGMTKEEFHLYK